MARIRRPKINRTVKIRKTKMKSRRMTKRKVKINTQTSGSISVRTSNLVLSRMLATGISWPNS